MLFDPSQVSRKEFIYRTRPDKGDQNYIHKNGITMSDEDRLAGRSSGRGGFKRDDRRRDGNDRVSEYLLYIFIEHIFRIITFFCSLIGKLATKHICTRKYLSLATALPNYGMFVSLLVDWKFRMFFARVLHFAKHVLTT